MSVKYLALYLFAIVLIEVNSQVCTRTITTYTEQFTVSGNAIKNRTINPPFLNVIKNCCPGYYNVNPQEEASSENCLKLCKMNCKMEPCVNEYCICPEGFIKDTTGTVCIPKCDPGFNYVNGTCQLESDNSSESHDSSDNKTDSDVVHDKVHSTKNISGQYSPFETVFYVSAATNIILLLLIVVIVLSKCKNGARGNKNNVTARCDTYVDMAGAQRNPVRCAKNGSVPENTMPGSSGQYAPMDGDHRQNSADPPKYESIHYSAGSRETLCYDYVQTPLPIHLRKAVQGMPRRS